MGDTLTERAFERFYADPAIKAARARFNTNERLVLALVRAAFMDGAKYATDRCAAEGHHSP